MTTTDMERHASPAPATPWLGQGTAIEQSRAMAEVQAAVVIAQQCPRNQQAALASMRDSCRQMRLAERAFYRFNRGGQQISGPTVHLARELARVWGNVTYGISELSRDDARGQSEMQAWAWDLQTNTRSAQIFIVPHMRDKKGGPEKLTELRSIYEENANQGSRRLRQAIWSILPPWLVEEAEELCAKTLKDGGGVPLPQRISKAIDMLAGRGVSEDRIEARLGRPSSKWTEHDVAELGVIFKSLDRGEIRVEDEFPAERVTAAEVAAQAKRAPAGKRTEAVTPPPADPDASGWGPEPGTDGPDA